jgi:hypothetical protein
MYAISPNIVVVYTSTELNTINVSVFYGNQHKITVGTDNAAACKTLTVSSTQSNTNFGTMKLTTKPTASTLPASLAVSDNLSLLKNSTPLPADLSIFSSFQVVGTQAVTMNLIDKQHYLIQFKDVQVLITAKVMTKTIVYAVLVLPLAFPTTTTITSIENKNYISFAIDTALLPAAPAPAPMLAPAPAANTYGMGTGNVPDIAQQMFYAQLLQAVNGLSNDIKQQQKAPAPQASSSSNPAPSVSASSAPASSYNNSLGGVGNNLIDKGSNLAGKVLDDATGLVGAAGVGTAMLATGAAGLAKDAGSGATGLLKDAGSGATGLLKDAGSGAMQVAGGVGGEISDVISGVGNELAYLANKAVDGGGAAGQVVGPNGQPMYAAINAVGPAYITGYGNNMAPGQIPSVYNYYGSSTGAPQQTWNVMPYPDSFAAFTR